MPKIFPLAEKRRVWFLADEERSHTEIANIMADEFPDNWNTKSAARTVARIIKEHIIEEDDTKTYEARYSKAYGC